MIERIEYIYEYDGGDAEIGYNGGWVVVEELYNGLSGDCDDWNDEPDLTPDIEEEEIGEEERNEVCYLSSEMMKLTKVEYIHTKRMNIRYLKNKI